ncbi:MAG: hypothetical protein AAF750_04880 [Planctomycetota bacterium]
MLETVSKTRHRSLRHSLLGAAAVAALGLGASAHAGSVSLVGSAGLQDSLSFDLGDGLTMTITGTTVKQALGVQDAQVGQDADGLGVTNGFQNDSYVVDGKRGDDTLWITFSDEVTLTGFGFNDVDNNDDAKLLDADGDKMVKFDVLSTVSFSDVYTGTTFGVQAFGNGDDFLLSELSYIYEAPVSDPPIDPVPVTALPTPSAALAGAVTLGLLTLRRRRQAAEG